MTTATAHEPALSRNSLLKLIPAVALPVAASLLGQIATFPNLVPWHASLIKPWFNPPNWLFGPVWTFLYAVMAITFWRVLRLPAQTPGRKLAIAAFAIQMVLNIAWSWAFFGLHSPGLGLGVSIALFLAVAATIAAFARVDLPAGLALLPYALWVGFATVLNAEIWRLNG